jgi:hypothetical protein
MGWVKGEALTGKRSLKASMSHNDSIVYSKDYKSFSES